MKRQRNSVWLELSKDKYKLPVVVANSAEELSKKTGAGLSNIYSQACKNRRNGYEGRFIEVILDDEKD